jgi:hypothetical protein
METIKTQGLPDGTYTDKVYTFYIDAHERKISLKIPAYGPKVEAAEQLAWINTLDEIQLTHIQTGEWVFENMDSYCTFLELLNNCLISEPD